MYDYDKHFKVSLPIGWINKFYQVYELLHFIQC